MVSLADTPAGRIARLDDALARRGQRVLLRKTNTAVGQVRVPAKVRFYKAEELTGLVIQGDSKVVVSPTGLSSFGIPPSSGFVVVDGKPRRIISVYPIYDIETLVRIDIQVRG